MKIKSIAVIGLFIILSVFTYTFAKQFANNNVSSTEFNAINTNAINNAVNTNAMNGVTDEHETPSYSSISEALSANILREHTSLEEATIDKVFVDKSEQRLYLMQGDVAIKSYHIALGDNPKGHKQQEGDERTPEGMYTLDYKNENSIAYRSIHVSYPNVQDIAHANKMGVSPGGSIMIHGQMNGYGQYAAITQQQNWTDGCMAVTDNEMDEIMDAVKVGTPIEIVW